MTQTNNYSQTTRRCSNGAMRCGAPGSKKVAGSIPAGQKAFLLFYRLL